MTTRIFNIIKRAEDEFDFKYDINDSLQDILDNAMNTIEDNVDYDYIDVCERNRHYDHISWEDGKGFVLEADGEFISSDERLNQYFRRDEKGSFNEIAWYDQTEDDYILVWTTIDSEGKKVALVCK